MNSVLTEKELKSLNWAERSGIALLDKYIIVNAHLSSKADKNRIQIDELKKALIELKNNHPNNHIIVGGDLNSFLGNDEAFEKDFSFYPNK